MWTIACGVVLGLVIFYLLPILIPLGLVLLVVAVVIGTVALFWEELSALGPLFLGLAAAYAIYDVVRDGVASYRSEGEHSTRARRTGSFAAGVVRGVRDSIFKRPTADRRTSLVPHTCNAPTSEWHTDGFCDRCGELQDDPTLAPRCSACAGCRRCDAERRVSRV